MSGDLIIEPDPEQELKVLRSVYRMSGIQVRVLAVSLLLQIVISLADLNRVGLVLDGSFAPVETLHDPTVSNFNSKVGNPNQGIQGLEDDRQ